MTVEHALNFHPAGIEARSNRPEREARVTLLERNDSRVEVLAFRRQKVLSGVRARRRSGRRRSLESSRLGDFAEDDVTAVVEVFGGAHFQLLEVAQRLVVEALPMANMLSAKFDRCFEPAKSLSVSGRLMSRFGVCARAGCSARMTPVGSGEKG